MKQRLLISGFEPFGGMEINPSAEIVSDRRWLQSATSRYDVEAAILPVTFGVAFETLQRYLGDFKPDIVLALGLATGRERLTVERVAINRIDADIADNNGVKPGDRAILEDGPTALFATIPLHAMVNAATAAGVPAAVSNTAGTYVCNFVFYRLLVESRFTLRRCGFIHLPCSPDQFPRADVDPSNASEALAPSMSLEQMRLGLAAMLAVVHVRI